MRDNVKTRYGAGIPPGTITVAAWDRGELARKIVEEGLTILDGELCHRDLPVRHGPITYVERQHYAYAVPRGIMTS